MASTQRPWLRILAEGAAILFSILLAFAIDARWDLSREEERVRSVLASLEAGYSDNLAAIDAQARQTRGFLQNLERVLSSDANSVRGLPPDSASQMFAAITVPGTTNQNNDYLVALLDAESLSVLNDAPLREAIARWRNDLTTVSWRREQIGFMEREAKRALGRHPEIRPALAGGLPGASPVSPDALRAVLEDEEIMALITAKANDWHIYLLLLDRLRTSSATVLELVQHAQERQAGR